MASASNLERVINCREEIYPDGLGTWARFG
jgi:hypothetical protein